MMPYFAGLAAAMIWGGWFPITRMGVLDQLNIFDLSLLRYAVAGLALLPLVLRRRLYAKAWPVWGMALVILGAGLPYMLLAGSGLRLIPVSHSILAPCTMAISSLILSSLVWRTWPTATQWSSAALVVLGAGLLIVEPTGSDRAGHILGHGLVIMAGFVWAIYTVALKYHNLNALDSTAILSVVSGLLALPLWFLWGHDWSNVAPATLAAQAVYQGLLSGVAALFLYAFAVGRLGAARAALFAVLVPVFANIFAVPILGEWPTVQEALALGILCLGLALGLNLIRFPRLQRMGPGVR